MKNYIMVFISYCIKLAHEHSNDMIVFDRANKKPKFLKGKRGNLND